MNEMPSAPAPSGVTSRLRILWLSHFVPFPPKGGCFQRSYNLLSRIGRQHDVHLVAVRAKPPASAEAETAYATDALGVHCASVDIVDISAAYRPARLARLAALGLASGQPLTVTLYRSPEARRRLRSLLDRFHFDVVHVDSISMAEYLADLGGVPTILTHHGAEAFMMRRRIANERSLPRKLFFLLESLTLARVERRVCPAAGSNAVVSDLDRDLLRQHAPGARYIVVENGVDVDFFQPLPCPAAPSIVFAGRLDQYANRDAMRHFMRHTWPLVTERHPAATITIIGSNPPADLQQMAAVDRRVRVLGFVDDVRPHFAQAAVAVCPLRDGGGTRIKILDALAMGKPIVSTTIGCEGLDVEGERDLLLADDPAAFAAQIARVFDDPALRERLARQARDRAVERYSWERIVRDLAAEYTRVASPRPVPAAPGSPVRQERQERAPS